jgi:hypothetical protein
MGCRPPRRSLTRRHDAERAKCLSLNAGNKPLVAIAGGAVRMTARAASNVEVRSRTQPLVS